MRKFILMLIMEMSVIQISTQNITRNHLSESRF